MRLRRGGNRFRVAVDLPAGAWRVRVRYVDRGIVEAGRSRARSVTAG